MNSVELRDVMADFGRLINRVEETGERVRITDDGESAGVILPAAELAELEHFAQRVPGAPRPRPRTVQERPLGPEQQGPYVRYVHTGGVRRTFTRDRVIVAELLPVDELDWLEDKARTGRQSYMDPKQAAAFEEFLARQRPIGDGIAWIADGWRSQQPFTVLEFIKGPPPEEVALAYGADPRDIADGLLLHQVWERDGREGTDDFLDVLAFGQAAGWTWLGYHDFAGAFSGFPDPPPQQITMTAIEARAIYDFRYSKDGVHQNPSPTEDGAVPEMYELIWYTPGETPFDPSAPLAFLNAHIRRAEEETDWADGISLFFAGLERAFGLSLPRDAITSGHVRCAYPAPH
ncbi:type II toxin-antitoxin system Phd/YefM family antitoxin [Actinomadura sp. WMMB 499]|uniref:type II toxin-antitoxin system Phd/YefM family antitoxin n=1 Tax=Actinomadura sp. WMMB 499 TaxID=1219491 RepID=UPI001246D9E0|nr:type II toxin-antitoxin system Phd/YefM family antitoxin [Actinomadura sp. WMMB 499]QFG22857.1 type II toxin-antitoxin system Phd/YefM family antitoxin [Actinomadura sp. WMMB 499]